MRKPGEDKTVAIREQEPPTISVVILYEDVACGKRAKGVYDALATRLQGAGVFDYQLWKFGALAHEQLSQMAASEAAMSDIIFIAARGDADLPETVKSWLEFWIDGHHQPGALVALFNFGDAVEHICRYLRELANRGRLDFFAPVNSAGRFAWTSTRLQP